VQSKKAMQNLSTGQAFLKAGAWDDAVTEAGPVFLECSSSLAFTASKHTSQTLSNKKMLTEQTSLCHLALLAWRVCYAS
jgi:hypothetical protein